MGKTRTTLAILAAGILCLLLTPALASAGTIAGTVTEAGTSEPIEGVHVCADGTVLGPEGGCAFTDAEGEYSIPGLETGSYKVDFNGAEYGLNYIAQYYDDEATFEDAEWVNVSGESVTSGIDAVLEVGGQITGTVTDESNSEPIEGVDVCAFRISEDFTSCDETDAAGEYAVVGLPTNSFKVEFAASGYETEYYNSKFSWFKANSVAVVAGEITAEIDAELTPIPSEPGAQGEQPETSSAGSVNPLVTPAGPFVTAQPPSRKQLVCRNGKRKRLVKGKPRCVRKRANHRPNAR